MIGKMKYRVTIEEAVLTPDGAGGFTETWQAIATAPTVYASIVPASAGAMMKFGGVETEVTHDIVLRYRTDVTAGMRLVDENGVIYLVTASVPQDGAHFFLAISASARPAG